MSDFKLLIIGGGLSAINAYQLSLRYNIRPLIIDDNVISASHVAAGMLNPLTGRNLSKTWLCDNVFPFAHSYYKSCENFYGNKFLYSLPIYHLFRDEAEENDIYAKSADPNYRHLISTDSELRNSLPAYLKENSKGAFFRQGGFIDINNLLNQAKQHAKNNCNYLNESFNWNDLKLLNGKVEYKGKDYNAILDCTGIKVSDNPYFSKLPVMSNKGEILGLKGKLSGHSDYLYHKKIFIFKHPDGLLRVGSTYSNTDKSTQNTQAAVDFLIEKANAIMPDNYIISKHWNGFRPTTPDRRPIVGQHPKHKNLFILNGMGSKGATLSPFFAFQLIRDMLYKSPVNELVKPNRFF
ncbi:MAG: FAD-binding oxidoreductase [Chitinophagaceae bacterium]|nr:MAG: FAD-binding oxidoreductase [Chitinophagaceae bacterium]